MVSNAKEDFPEPLRPVITMRRSLGISTSIFFRLWAFAPLMMIFSAAIYNTFLRESVFCSKYLITNNKKIFSSKGGKKP